MTTGSELMVIKPSANLPMIVEENSLFSYLEKIKKFPVLSEKEEQNLISDFHETGNLDSAHKLVVSHLRLAAKISYSYRRYGLPMADIISEANIGLMQAVKKFDLSKNVRLSTYAIWWIKAAINDFVLRSWSLVKIGTKAAQKKLFYNLSRIKARLGIYDNKALEPKVVKDIAHELMVEEQDVVEMSVRLSGDKSLNVTIDEDGESEQIDMLVDASQNLEEKYARKEQAGIKHKVLYKCLSKLNEREQEIVKERMLTDKPITLEELGVRFNISRERIRQIEKRAFEKLSELVKLELKAAL
ncbi:MAG: RNA polymerase factor sigma-32 [Lactobacillus sp.]|jgi:RNA polymerase sigma-32 factor|nr:RNA polymerase factor sigma-32 [Lactobacillus sp.]